MVKQTAWEALENRVRTVASYIWDTQAKAEEIHGVSCDAVLKPEPDRWILIEVSRSKTLEKLRTDLAKFAAVRPALMAEGIFAKCYFVCEGAPSESLVRTATALNVSAISAEDLEKQFFDYQRYYFVRNTKSFGSAVDPLSGEKDKVPYVKVTYEEVSGRKEYDLEDLRKLLISGGKIVLLGNYGTGKSRCFQELFAGFEDAALKKHVYPVAIDLRDNWGLRRGAEVIRRHFEDLGLDRSSTSALKVIDKGSLILLLDGFDEIASQVWSDDPLRLEDIRAQSLSGVKDVISISRGGVLISGREHYFNSDDEMFRCLGLEADKTTVVRCADEFSEAQMNEYIGTINRKFIIPKWLPRRPLVSKILAGLDAEDLTSLLSERGEISFWHRLLDAICIRESRIHTSLDPQTIRNVLLELAQLSRTKPNNVGPISLAEINETFERVVGYSPRDEASAMLQRLPILGRLEAGSSDRQFLDTYILEGLRATAIIELVSVGAMPNVLNEKWHYPLGNFGHSILADNIATTNSESLYIRLLRQSAGSLNRVLAGDILTALLTIEEASYDFENLEIADSHIGAIDLSGTEIKNLRIVDSVVDELTIAPKGPENVFIKDCLIDTLRGLSRSDELPQWIENPTINHFDALTNVAKIKQAGLSKEQQIFVTIIHKTFFQPGGGRKEDALLRGLGATADQKAAKRVLGFLIENQILDTFPGKQGPVYTPVRKHSRRLGKILSLLRHSNDPLWKRLSDN